MSRPQKAVGLYHSTGPGYAYVLLDEHESEADAEAVARVCKAPGRYWWGNERPGPAVPPRLVVAAPKKAKRPGRWTRPDPADGAAIRVVRAPGRIRD